MIDRVGILWLLCVLWPPVGATANGPWVAELRPVDHVAVAAAEVLLGGRLEEPASLRFDGRDVGLRAGGGSTQPKVEHVRVKNNEIWIEVSEDVQEDVLQKAVADNTLRVEKVTSGQTIDIQVDRPVLGGRQARRRLVITGVDPSDPSWPVADDVATSNYSKTFTWPSGDLVVEDSALPRLDRVCITPGRTVELEFTEELATAYLATEILIDGAAVTWTADASGYVLTTENALAEGSYQLTIGIGPLDLADKGLAEGYSETLVAEIGVLFERLSYLVSTGPCSNTFK